MGQKINPIISRLESTEEWKSKYFEKKSTELSTYTFKDIEIKKFIQKYFKNHGLTVQTVKLYYLESTLHAYISYFLTIKILSLVNSLNKTQKIKFIRKIRFIRKVKRLKHRKNYLSMKKKIKKYFNYQKLKYNINLRALLEKTYAKRVSKIIRNSEKIIKIRRIKLLKYYKKYHSVKKKIKNKAFLESFVESLTQFTNRKLNIFITLYPLNKSVKQAITKKKFTALKKSLTRLRKYQRNEFFKEGVNLLFFSIVNGESSNLLAYFIVDQLKKLKRHNFFLKFLKTGLKVFSQRIPSVVKGIKIKIKGRFNGAPRARCRTIRVGNGVTALTLNSDINYSEATAYTSNGTFGVKVWICNKKQVKNDYVKRAKTN